MNLCQECRSCCYFKEKDTYYSPIFTKEELKKIPKGKNKFYPFKKSKKIFQLKLIKSKKHKELVCPYLNEDTHLCKIYKIRPLDCKIWPLLFMYTKNKDKILLACWDKDACPRTDRMSRKEYKKYLVEQEKELSKINLPEFLKKYPEYIWNYERYTFKVKEISRKATT